MTRQGASVDLRQGEYIVSTYSKTTAGFWVLDGTPSRMPQDAAPHELGAAIRTALGKSREGLQAPGRDDTPSKPLLDLLGLPDYATYAKGTRSVGVRLESSDEGETVELTPRRNEGARRGFTPITNEKCTFPYTSPEQLGNEVIKAFDKTA